METTRTEFRHGYIQVYTGNGKGKTTAALGLALRASGRGLRVAIIQFLKGVEYGELFAIRERNPLITIRQFGKPTFVGKHTADDEDRRLCSEGMAAARVALTGGGYDIVILDEINVAVEFELVTETEVLELIDTKPVNVELILTGRWARQSVIDRADLVTEMREVKHYYSQNVEAREGIEK